MEKLLMLLDIYEEEVVGIHSIGDKITEKDEAWICSKKFGFIKRLISNDKIKKNYKEGLPAITKNGFLLEGETALLMLLAISDTPIDDLIKLLK